MYETNLPAAGHEIPSADGALRVPDWSELTVRLGAARDLRAALYGSNSRLGGGFARFSAAEPEQVNANDVRVNLTGLAHGKDDAATIPVKKQGAPQVDREMQ